jgi:hypothetical protein
MRSAVVAVMSIAGVAFAGPVNKVKLSVGHAVFAGCEIDAETIETVVRRSSSRLLACYQKIATKQQLPDGDIDIHFTIEADGKTSDVEVQGIAANVEACIATTFDKLKFSVAKEREPTGVQLTLTYDAGQAGQAPFVYGQITGIDDLSWRDEPAAASGIVGNASSDPPTSWRAGMKLGQPAVKGDLDQAIVRRCIKRRTQSLVYCYEKELLARPGLAGTITAQFEIDAEGNVAKSSATGFDSDLSSCVAAVIRAGKFPKHRSGAVEVSYPLTFWFNEEDAKQPRPAKPATKPKPPANNASAPLRQQL